MKKLALALVLALAFSLFTGCGGTSTYTAPQPRNTRSSRRERERNAEESGSQADASAEASEAASEPESEESEPESVSSAPSSSSAAAPGGVSRTEPSVPGYTLVTADTMPPQGSSWFHFPGQTAEGLEVVYQYRFDELPGEMLASYGLYQTDAGYFFRGPYHFVQDGIVAATLTLSDFEVPPDTPVIEIEFKIEWVPDGSALVITLLSIDTTSELFLGGEDADGPYGFSHLIGVPMELRQE